MNRTNYIVLLHNLEESNSLKMDFESELQPNQLIKTLQIESCKLTQFIKHEYLVEISETELERNNIPIEKITRTKKTWFGLSSKNVNDILITTNSEFMYPHIFGNFVYFFSKSKIGKNELQDWLNSNLSDLDGIYSAMNNYNTKLIQEDDYVIVTNYDTQTQFGISGGTEKLKQIRQIMTKIGLENISTEKYKQTPYK